MGQLFAAFGLDGSLLLAQAINFGVLMVVLWFVLYKPVMKMLEARRQKIAQGVEDAEKAAQKLATADEEASSRVRGAEQEADSILTLARKSGQTERERIIKEAEARSAAIEADADARAKETAAKTLRDSEKEVARLAVLAAEKVLRQKAS